MNFLCIHHHLPVLIFDLVFTVSFSITTQSPYAPPPNNCYFINIVNCTQKCQSMFKICQGTCLGTYVLTLDRPCGPAQMWHDPWHASEKQGKGSDIPLWGLAGAVLRGAVVRRGVRWSS